MSEGVKRSAGINPMSAGQMTELRRAITGLDKEEFQRLSDLVQNPELFSEEISLLLPLSIKKLSDKGEIDIESLRGLVEQVLEQSVKQNPRSLANILFPIMMPAIRKAVAEDITKMVDTLNTSLEYGFSLKRMGWRLQALFSGRKYAEIVLSHAYVFKVNQVFLIHKSTGLLLHQVQDAELQQTSDADMVSSMLSAIKDFVQDSFQRGSDEGLDTIKVGNFNIWMEQGPHAIIAATVEGNAPGELRLIMKEAMEAIHVNLSYELNNFQGDTEVFNTKDRFLQNCLLKEKKEVKKKPPYALTAILAALLVALGYWIYMRVDENQRFDHLIKTINSLPGVLVTDSYKQDGLFIVEGMTDPEVGDFNSLVLNQGFDSDAVRFQMEEFISLDKQIVLKRANRLLTPPDSITLSVKGDTLLATGNADGEWIRFAENRAMAITGVSFFQMRGNVIHSRHEPEPMMEQLERSVLAIENYYFVFEFGEVQLDSLQKEDFDLLITEVKTVLNFDFNQDSIPAIEIISHTSFSGNPEANSAKAQQRADRFIDFMIAAGIPVEVLIPKVVFIEDANDGLPVRSVSFKVKYVTPASL